MSVKEKENQGGYMSSGTRNRQAGHNWERECVKDLKGVFPKAVSSRMESKSADDAGKDICNTGDFDFQCKNTAKLLNYDEILDDMRTDGIKVILHNYTQKKGKRFMTKDKYAIMRYEDFIDLLINIDIAMNPVIDGDEEEGLKFEDGIKKKNIGRNKTNQLQFPTKARTRSSVH